MGIGGEKEIPNQKEAFLPEQRGSCSSGSRGKKEEALWRAPCKECKGSRSHLPDGKRLKGSVPNKENQKLWKETKG